MAQKDKYKKKVEQIVALQFTGIGLLAEATILFGDTIRLGTTKDKDGATLDTLVVDTVLGPLEALIGEYMVMDSVSGTFTVLSEKGFNDKYEKA